jgi:hypothetical protein
MSTSQQGIAGQTTTSLAAEQTSAISRYERPLPVKTAPTPSGPLPTTNHALAMSNAASYTGTNMRPRENPMRNKTPKGGSSYQSDSAISVKPLVNSNIEAVPITSGAGAPSVTPVIVIRPVTETTSAATAVAGKQDPNPTSSPFNSAEVPIHQPSVLVNKLPSIANTTQPTPAPQVTTALAIGPSTSAAAPASAEAVVSARPALASPLAISPNSAVTTLPSPPPNPNAFKPAQTSSASLPFVTTLEAGTLKLNRQRPLLLQMKADVYRTFTVDPSICDVVRITQQDISLTGRATGSTHVTFFLDDPTQPQLTYLVEVTNDVAP